MIVGLRAILVHMCLQTSRDSRKDKLLPHVLFNSAVKHSIDAFPVMPDVGLAKLVGSQLLSTQLDTAGETSQKFPKKLRLSGMEFCNFSDFEWTWTLWPGC